MSSREILVTGGAGYIGSHMALRLSQQGYAPVVYDNLSTGHRRAVQWGPFYQGDVRDKKTLSEVFEKHQFAGVCHFAALSLVSESVREPEKYFDNNVLGSKSLIETCEKFGVRNFVFSSTCAVYGEPERLPLKEDHPKRPLSPYGDTKLKVEQALEASSLNVVSLRYFNACGADPETRIGESHDPETHLIPNAIKAAHQKLPMQIFGNDYSTSDGTCVRDYIHVLDLADAHIQALELMALEPKKNFRFYNLGTGRGFSSLEILKSVERVTGKKIDMQFAARRAGDPATLYAHVQKSEQELLWKTQWNELDQIIKTANDWYLQKK
jgi:UDP-arabinose 4-epimerase